MFVSKKRKKNICIREGDILEEMRVSRILACYPPFSASPSGLNFPLRPPVTKYDFILDFCSSYRETFVSGGEKEIVVSRRVRGRALPRYVTNDSFETHLKKKGRKNSGTHPWNNTC